MAVALATLASTLNATLAPHAWSALGIDDVSDVVNLPRGVELEGFLVWKPATTFEMWLATNRSLTRFEMNLAGETLTITVPHRRVRRISESRAGDVFKLLIELDADRIRTVAETEVLETDITDDPEGSTRRLSRGTQTSTMLPTTYELVSGVEGGPSADQIAAFARALRRIL